MADLTQLIEPLIPALRRYARSFLRDSAAADDLVQDTLERAIGRWHQRRPGADVRTWLSTIVHNLAVNRLRHIPLAIFADMPGPARGPATALSARFRPICCIRSPTGPGGRRPAASDRGRSGATRVPAAKRPLRPGTTIPGRCLPLRACLQAAMVENGLRRSIGPCGLFLALSLGAGGAACVSRHAAAADSEGAYLALNDAAMNRMMSGIEATPTSDADRDFVAMMAPHHQGAVDMAQAELLYGHNRQLLRIAQQIIVEQIQEMAAMRLAIGEPARATWVASAASEVATSARPSGPGGDAASVSLSRAAMDRMMAAMAITPTGNVDHDFVAMMVPHHQAAIEMAQAELQYGKTLQLKTIAQEIIVDQQQEISLMRLALGEALPRSAPSPTQIPPGAVASAAAQMPGQGQDPSAISPDMHMAPARTSGHADP